jgi:hypothetical protein
VPPAGVVSVGGVGDADCDDEADEPGGHGEELRSNRRVAQTRDDSRSKKRKRALGNHISNIRKVVEEHARAEQRLQHLSPARMFLVVPPAAFSQAVDGEFLLRAGEPGCKQGVVWQEEDEEEGGEERDDAFDYEEPSEPLEARGAVNVADPEGNGAAEGAGEVAEGDDEGDAEGALVVAVPDGYEVDYAFAPRVSVLRSPSLKKRDGFGERERERENIPGKNPASNTPIKNRSAMIVALFLTPENPIVSAPHAKSRIPNHSDGRT